MDSIKDVLKEKDFQQPDEIQQIKDFVKAKFDEEPRVKIVNNNIVISVSNASLAGALRVHLHHLSKEIGTDKKLLLKIS
ncbi:MAG TPA: hypothetical protein VFX86_03645 [Candidatus Saccharimonadales bacterium]|nr:hypothetical protein [Candidatus Saccharimonadales bacterium]